MDKDKKVYDEIARVAYGLFERRGGIHGYAYDDWFEAERIILGKHIKEIEQEAGSISAAKRKKASGKTEAKIAATSPKTVRKTAEKTSVVRTKKASPIKKT